VDQVSIHAPVRGATSESRPQSELQDSFNPRPRAGGDTMRGGDEITVENVSIHAPVRGATAMDEKIRAAFEVSIHAPVRGATF